MFLFLYCAVALTQFVLLKALYKEKRLDLSSVEENLFFDDFYVFMRTCSAKPFLVWLCRKKWVWGFSLRCMDDRGVYKGILGGDPDDWRWARYMFLT